MVEAWVKAPVAHHMVQMVEPHAPSQAAWPEALVKGMVLVALVLKGTALVLELKCTGGRSYEDDLEHRAGRVTAVAARWMG